LTHEGELIAGRYRLQRKIGRGAMGVVWQAQDERLKRPVAVKQLLPDSALDDTAPFRSVMRAMREARVAARLKHPHAIAVYDVAEQDGTPFLVMEFLPSRPLTELLAEHGSLEPGRVTEIGIQIASALAAAHEREILHRDVTPNNVLIGDDGTAKIADFGISHATGEGTMTGQGMVVGTPAFLAPEVADGKEPGYPSDVFSLGSTLYTALEGTPPYGTDDNQIALLKRIAHDGITAPRNTGPLANVLMRMLRHDPEERPTSAQAEMMLRAAAEGGETDLPDTKRIPPLTRRPLLRFVVAGVVVAGGIVAGVSIFDREPSGTVQSAPEPSKPLPNTTPPPPHCMARYEVTNRWPGGAEIQISVRNERPSKLTGWEVSWTLAPGTRIANLWNGDLAQNGDKVTVTNLDWNATLPANQSTTFGLIATSDGQDEDPPVAECRTFGPR
jgi:serine/threonine protein kinase